MGKKVNSVWPFKRKLQENWTFFWNWTSSCCCCLDWKSVCFNIEQRFFSLSLSLKSNKQSGDWKLSKYVDAEAWVTKYLFSSLCQPRGVGIKSKNIPLLEQQEKYSKVAFVIRGLYIRSSNYPWTPQTHNALDIPSISEIKTQPWWK